MRASNRVFNAPLEKPVIETGSETRTQQHHAKSADLNEIVRRFGVTGAALPPAPLDPRYYGDFTDTADLQTALDRVRAAQDHFESLPAKVRDRFANDPVRLHRFVMDPDNAEEAVKLGLLHKRAKPEPPAPIEVRVVSDSTTAVPSTNATA